jgi:hypothetical protein
MKRRAIFSMLVIAVLIIGALSSATVVSAAATVSATLACPNITIEHSVDNPMEGFVEVDITIVGPSGTLDTYSSEMPNNTFTSLASGWAYTPASGSVINVFLSYTINGGESGGGEASTKLTYNCGGVETTSSPGCSVPEGANQDLLTAPHLLYWGPDLSKGTTKTIPAGAVVSVLDNKTPGWLKINWACGTYYILAVDHVPNPAKVTKPFSGSK